MKNKCESLKRKIKTTPCIEAMNMYSINPSQLTEKYYKENYKQHMKFLSANHWPLCINYSYLKFIIGEKNLFITVCAHTQKHIQSSMINKNKVHKK